MGSMVKFYMSGDSHVIPKLVKRSLDYYDEDLDVDPDDPEFEVVNCEQVSVEDYFTSSFAGGIFHWGADDEDEYSWAEAPEHLHDEIIENFEDDLVGGLVLLQVDLPHEHDDDSTTFSMLIDDGMLGYVEVRHIWHGPGTRDITENEV